LLEELQGLIQKSEGDNLKELADAFEVVQGKVLSLNKEIKAVDTEVKELKDDLSEPIKLDVNTDKEKIDKLIGSIGDAKKQVQILEDNPITIDVEAEGLDEVEQQVENINVSLQTRIKLAIEASESANTVGEVRNSLKELQSLSLEIGDVTSVEFNKVAEAAGNLKDRVSDTRDAFNTFSGKPISDLTRGIGGLRASFLSLDFEGFNEQATRLAQVSKNLSFTELGKSTKALTSSFAQLGKALLTNPLFILGTTIALIVLNFEKLQKVGGVVGEIFSG